MDSNTQRQDERRNELERIATSDPERLERLFREYFPTSTLPAVGSKMVDAILGHETKDRATIPRED